MQPKYQYKAKIIYVVDGDTIDARVDLGFGIFTDQRFRLEGIDTPELRSEDNVQKELANKAKNYVEKEIAGKDVIIVSTRKDKYGRWLCDVYESETQPTINEQLIALGYAKSYFGGKK